MRVQVHSADCHGAQSLSGSRRSARQCSPRGGDLQITLLEDGRMRIIGKALEEPARPWLARSAHHSDTFSNAGMVAQVTRALCWKASCICNAVWFFFDVHVINATQAIAPTDNSEKSVQVPITTAGSRRLWRARHASRPAEPLAPGAAGARSRPAHSGPQRADDSHPAGALRSRLPYESPAGSATIRELFERFPWILLQCGGPYCVGRGPPWTRHRRWSACGQR